MKAYILYHPESDHARLVEEYARDFERRKYNTIELLSLETREGANTARLYGIVQYPALIVTRENGELAKNWEGSQLPLMDEVAGYLDQNTISGLH